MAVPPPHSPPPDDKAALRRRLRATRAAHVAALGADGIVREAARIAARLAPLLAGSRIVGGYAAHRGEPDVLAAMLAAHARGAALALPRIEADGAMRFVGWHPDAGLTPGFAGIAEPAAASTIAPDTLIVPLVGFDRERRRLGQGGGCYDRWLAAHRGVRTIGVAWSVQEVSAIPADPWDVALDSIVTEAQSIPA